MLVRNYLEMEIKEEQSHHGNGLVRNVLVYGAEDFDSKLQFLYLSELPPGTSIGYHEHGQNEEIYVVMEGVGTIRVNGEERSVKTGDVLLNKPGWSHGLENTGDGSIKLLVFEAGL